MLDRDAVPCDVPGEAAGEGFTWDAADRDDRGWWPQGVATTRGADVLLVAWYAKGGPLGLARGSRVSVVDRRDPSRPRYGHVALVVPRPLGRGAAPVRVHAGGLAVVGDLLYVADTLLGVRVFRLDDLQQTPRGLVLPQSLALRLPLGRARSPLRCSFLFVGDVAGAPSLVVGEYRRAGASPRLLRYPLDPASGLPAAGADGTCTPVEVHHGQPPRMQGVAVDGSTWFLSASSGEGNPGDLHVGAPGGWRRHRGVLPTGPEDLDRAGPGELWCATEWPGRRWVFPIDARRWARG